MEHTLTSIKENPTLSSMERDSAISSAVGSSASPILLNLLTVLSENGRLSSAQKVFADFNSLMAAYRGELEVIVTSAEALDSKAMSRLEKALKGSSVAEGKTLKIVNKVCHGGTLHKI
jgi:F-type H+-transporting ATPase subunit O